MIRVLAKNVSDKIAAGEVIERPVSIVKELAENSVDAGADSITVEIRNGGKSFIRVTDNGCGIDPEETETAFLRHATSKITRAEDLDSIESLGFRGEALASIAAVTRTTMITKTAAKKTGTRVVVHAGTVIEKSPVGCPNGTTMIVTDLFYNTPARREFLKTDGAESSRIVSLISEMAVLYPHIRFQMISAGRTVFTTSGSGSMKDAVLAVYQLTEYRDLVEVDWEGEGFRVTGCISRPSLSRPNRRNQIFYVNGRVVSSKVMEKGVSEGYRRRLFEGRFPVVFLHLQSDPAAVDVNIHPNKKEVRFHDDKAVVRVISAAVRQALASDEAVIEAADYFRRDEQKAEKGEQQETDLKALLSRQRQKTEHDLSPKPRSGEAAPPKDDSDVRTADSRNKITENQTAGSCHDLPDHPDPEEQELFGKLPGALREDAGKRNASGASFAAESRPSYDAGPVRSAAPAAFSDEKSHQDTVSGGADAASEESEAELHRPAADPEDFDLMPDRKHPFSFDDLQITGCIFNTYITCTDQDSFYLIDQHAAHERVFYEKLVGEYLASEKPGQQLLLPLIVEAPPALEEADTGWTDDLREMGYRLESFGPNTWRIDTIPTFMTMTEAEDFVKEFMAGADGLSSQQNKVVIDKLITKSCKSAVKAHDVLSPEEMQALLDQLKQCRNPFSCPHGRPTFIRFTKYEIEKFFKRIQ